jgi:hypothetical protein
VLRNVTDLFLRGEYSTRTSIGTLDNVVVGADAPRLVISSVTRTEGRTGLTPFQFNVSLSHFTAVPVTVRYSTSNQTALAGSDYNAVNNALVQFKVGERHKTVAVSVRGDRAREAAETFAVTLSSAANATIGQAVGIGTILNDD